MLASFTGGSSALACLPPEGVSAAEKRRLHELLLGSGAPIADVNAVRKHVSALKGGRLAAQIAPATLVNLTASDVAGDRLDAITDPTVEDGSTVGDAIEVLREPRPLGGDPGERSQPSRGRRRPSRRDSSTSRTPCSWSPAASACAAMAREAERCRLRTRRRLDRARGRGDPDRRDARRARPGARGCRRRR